VHRISAPNKLADAPSAPRHHHQAEDGVSIGGQEVVTMAGPCSVEIAQQLFTAASKWPRQVRACLRGGAFKPRSSPYSFQGLGEEGSS